MSVTLGELKKSFPGDGQYYIGFRAGGMVVIEGRGGEMIGGKILKGVDVFGRVASEGGDISAAAALIALGELPAETREEFC